MAKLSPDFPGFAALDAAGEATAAKVRKRIAAGTLTEILGIGESTAEKIAEEFEKQDSPDAQAKEATEIDDGEAGVIEEDDLEPAQTTAEPPASDADQLSNCGYNHYDAPTGPYVAKGERIEGQRIKVTPISMIAPSKGLEVRDGDSVFTILEEYHDGPSDWLKVKNPYTGKSLI